MTILFLGFINFQYRYCTWNIFYMYLKTWKSQKGKIKVDLTIKTFDNVIVWVFQFGLLAGHYWLFHKRWKVWNGIWMLFLLKIMYLTCGMTISFLGFWNFQHRYCTKDYLLQIFEGLKSWKGKIKVDLTMTCLGQRRRSQRRWRRKRGYLLFQSKYL